MWLAIIVLLSTLSVHAAFHLCCYLLSFLTTYHLLVSYYVVLTFFTLYHQQFSCQSRFPFLYHLWHTGLLIITVITILNFCLVQSPLEGLFVGRHFDTVWQVVPFLVLQFVEKAARRAPEKHPYFKCIRPKCCSLHVPLRQGIETTIV